MQNNTAFWGMLCNPIWRPSPAWTSPKSGIIYQPSRSKKPACEATSFSLSCRLSERVCLVEVGTCFHPELTDRENIYLNGTILGITRAEIEAKFDEIVDFSGVEKFIDTPVKRYPSTGLRPSSSGMGVRLAFSVAAHLGPEILLVDEVLAGGICWHRQ